MKVWIILSASVLCILGSMGLREWLILEEVKNLQSSLETQMDDSLSNVDNLERLQQIQYSAYVYRRFIEPVLIESQRLLWPPYRSASVLNWERSLHQKLEDQSYTKATKLRQEISDQIQKARKVNEPGTDRLIQIAKLSQGFDKADDRITSIRDELESIQSAARNDDSKLIRQIAKSGASKIKELRTKIRKMGERELLSYLSSKDFYDEIQKPVLSKIQELKQPKLRTATWEEFQKQSIAAVNRKADLLAKVQKATAPKPEAEQADGSLSELLKEEYSRQLREEKESHLMHSPMTNPSDARTTADGLRVLP